MKMRVLDRYYRYWGDPGFIDWILKKNIKVDWIVEAGCHDGSDTLLLANTFPDCHVYAFEPDLKAFKKAEVSLNKLHDQVSLFQLALSNVEPGQYLKWLDGTAGTGSSQIQDQGEEQIKTVLLDDQLELNPKDAGLIWLDVEGHATNALLGMKRILRQAIAAKIEIQMHQMSEVRKKDYLNVIRIMKSANLIPLRGPLNPGFFGDLIFLSKKHCSFSERIQSVFLKIQLVILHEVFFPLLKRPKNPDKRV